MFESESKKTESKAWRRPAGTSADSPNDNVAGEQKNENDESKDVLVAAAARRPCYIEGKVRRPPSSCWKLTSNSSKSRNSGK